VIVLFDENFPLAATVMLGYFDKKHEMRHNSDYFKGTADADWMPEVSQWGKTAIVSMDGRILRNKVERHALRQSGLYFVYLKRAWSQMRWHDFAWRIIKIWPDIARSLEQAKVPMVFEVTAMKIQPVGRVSSL